MSAQAPLLVDYPWVLVRFACTVCGRRGQTRLARLAERYGADCTLERLLDAVAWTCPYPRHEGAGRKHRKYTVYCGIYLPDLEGRPRPPDLPGPHLQLIVSSEDSDAA
ncbi:MAG: hypothetical protein AB7D33_03530 [Sphingobium sp.]